MADAAVQRNDVDSEMSEAMDDDEMEQRVVEAIRDITKITKKVMKRLKRRKEKKLRKQKEKLGREVRNGELEDAGGAAGENIELENQGEAAADAPPVWAAGAPEENHEQDLFAIKDDESEYQGVAAADAPPVRAGGAPEENNEQDVVASEDYVSEYQGDAAGDERPVSEMHLSVRIFPWSERARGVHVPPRRLVLRLRPWT